jgi:hypothetical protein
VLAVAWPVAVVGAFGGSYALADAALPAGLVFADAHAGPAAGAPVDPQVERVQHLIDGHDCWSGATPAGMRDRIPGHAVVTLPGRRAAYFSSGIGFAVWTGDRAGTLHAFCR